MIKSTIGKLLSLHGATYFQNLAGRLAIAVLYQGPVNDNTKVLVAASL